MFAINLGLFSAQHVPKVAWSPFLSLSFSPSACLLITVTLFSIWMELGRTERNPYRAYTEWKKRSQMKAYGLCMRRCEIVAGGLSRLRSYSGRHRSYSRWANTRGSILCVKFPRVMSFMRMNQAGRPFWKGAKMRRNCRPDETRGAKYGLGWNFDLVPFRSLVRSIFSDKREGKKVIIHASPVLIIWHIRHYFSAMTISFVPLSN